MHQYLLHCTKIWDPAVRDAPYDLIFMDRGNVRSCGVCGKTNPTSSKAVTSRWLV